MRHLMLSESGCALFGLLLLATIGLNPALAFTPTALDSYIAEPHPGFAYTLVNTINGGNYTAYVYDMTSHSWRNSTEVSNPEWWHWLTIVVPNTVNYTKALLYLDTPLGGVGFNRFGPNELRGNPPTSVHPLLVEMATATNSIVVQCQMVPNQQLRFLDEPGTVYRHEDALLAYSWKKFFDTYDDGLPTDDYWPAQLPMTKTVVRAMDAAQAICQAQSHPLDGFVVSGMSKRGWAAWLAACVDSRVVAIAPLVIDTLNVQAAFQHHYDVLGSWSWAVQPYVDAGIMDRLGTPEAQLLMNIIDPYEYLDRLTLPKYIVNSAGDPFFLPDSSHFYFDDLQGPKWLRYCQNTNHNLNTDAFQGLEGFYWSILTNTTLPTYLTVKADDGSLFVWSLSGTVTSAKLWQANNPTAQDFRNEIIGNAYTDTTADYWGWGLFSAEVPYPALGWTAYYIELTYSNAGPQPYKFSTQVEIVLAGDVDGDLDVDDDDLAILEANIGMTDAWRCDGDMDGDYDVDEDDLTILMNNYGKGI